MGIAAPPDGATMVRARRALISARVTAAATQKAPPPHPAVMFWAATSWMARQDGSAGDTSEKRESPPGEQS
jgi:hypothetical protein